ncbi:FAD/NAD(P)-binding protein [Streptomyces sp. N2-109]|uniref:FAD/NAD(P)-binding protein n=1 Tax=Streptomyces gossypii TaxID=2883101 RepID=A0ABT2JQT5_9ACTN|nr:FAD/NAD(P)-binding protein [Streptomyces gossypii]MCT2590225.1 FAD/NAD(P)-binding protein [Streptomyces gossypii]
MGAAHPCPDQAVAVVGAGPRGTSVLERLCASVPELLPAGARLTVHIVDPAPPGPGHVWRTAQPGELLMNTVASQVTLFTDDSVLAEGPVRPGPSLYEWYARTAPGTLGPDDYPSRAQYGAYLEWVFAEVLRRAPRTVTVTVHRALAVRLADAPDGSQLLELADGTGISGLSAVVLAQGHLPSTASPEQRRLTEFAHTHGLRHLAPANPADLAAELDAIAPGERVLLRGLGLNFFDHMALLTSGRGGRFVGQGHGQGHGERHGLRYLPSGREPRLYAGSRRGVPYHARGDNEKGAHGRHLPLLLTPPLVARLRARAEAGEPPDFLTEIWPLVAKEVETVYYEARLAAAGEPPRVRGRFRARFLAVAHGSEEESAVLDAFGFGGGSGSGSGSGDSCTGSGTRAARWDWAALARPYGGTRFDGPREHRRLLLERLRQDIAYAREGNVHGPVKAALDVLRDLRNELRQIVDHGGLGGPSRRDHLDRWYTPLNAFLSIGPPRRRIEEMAALIEAGVLEVLGPGLDVRTDTASGRFTARSREVPGSEVTVSTLVEARLPEPDLRRTADPLLAGLLRAGACRPHTLGGYETGGLDVTERPYRVLDRQGWAHPARFAVGVPTEGVHWVTAAGARPGVNSVTLTDTDAVARAALGSLCGPLTVAAGVRNRSVSAARHP